MVRIEDRDQSVRFSRERLFVRREWTDPSRTFESSIRLLVVVFGDMDKKRASCEKGTRGLFMVVP